MEGELKTPRRILIVTLSFGSGHVRAAEAVARAIESEALATGAAADVRVVDALEGCRAFFRTLYVTPYWLMVRYAPRIWARLFAARVARRYRRTAPAWMFRLGCPTVFQVIREFRPDTIIAVEVAACEIAAMAPREGTTRARIVSVITDHDAEPVWVKAETETYFVADEAVRQQLLAWGANPADVMVSGIPIEDAFHASPGTQPRRDWNSEGEGLPVVLVMGGGMGPTRMDAVVAHLCRSGAPMSVIAVAGRDTRARRRLQRLVPPLHIRLDVIGWSAELPSLMQSASVLVTKPGGLTLAEAAACGLPIVMFDPIPGPEERNAAAIVAAGAGVLTRGPADTAAMTVALLRDWKRRASMSQRSRCLARPRAAHVIAQAALHQSHDATCTSAETMRETA